MGNYFVQIILNSTGENKFVFAQWDSHKKIKIKNTTMTNIKIQDVKEHDGEFFIVMGEVEDLR